MRRRARARARANGARAASPAARALVLAAGPARLDRVHRVRDLVEDARLGELADRLLVEAARRLLGDERATPPARRSPAAARVRRALHPAVIASPRRPRRRPRRRARDASTAPRAAARAVRISVVPTWSVAISSSLAHGTAVPSASKTAAASAPAAPAPPPPSASAGAYTTVTPRWSSLSRQRHRARHRRRHGRDEAADARVVRAREQRDDALARFEAERAAAVLGLLREHREEERVAAVDHRLVRLAHGADAGEVGGERGGLGRAARRRAGPRKGAAPARACRGRGRPRC